MATQEVVGSEVVEASRSLMEKIIGGYHPRDVAVRFWDGSVLDPDPGEPARCTIVLNHPGSVRAMFWPFNKLSLGEAYIYDDFDLEGDMVSYMKLLRYLNLNLKKWTFLEKASILWRLTRLPREMRPRDRRPRSDIAGEFRSTERDARAIQYHYDAPPEFFRLLLDPHMQYSCGYFRTPEDDLATAQQQKMDIICRKLRLQPGERLLDIGFGWGGLMMYAAQNYGVNVVGITISEEQHRWTQQAIREAGLESRCEVRLCDYRNLSESEQFDKAVSVEVVEHFGESLPIFFKKLHAVLKPGGMYMHHCITFKNFHVPLPRWAKFTRKYIFPDGEVAPLKSSLYAGELAGFEIRDIESLREHYIRTLECWLHNLEKNHDQAVALTDEVFWRIFRLYLAGAAMGFRRGTSQLYQTLFVKNDEEGKSGFPLTREDWYQ